MRRSWLAPFLATALAVPAALANPVGPGVAAGSAAFQRTGIALTVTNAPGTIINWQGFSIGAGELTRFRQQNAMSAVLNRVVSGNPSSIFGQLQSNGRVFLVNPNGIVFGAGAVIDTAGLVASTLNITDRDFLAGRLNFAGGGQGALRNEGTLRAGGDIYLVGPQIENTGLIRSESGNVLLAAGQSVTITGPDAQGVQFALQAPGDAALNLGTIEAKNAATMFAGTLRHSGDVRANRVTLSATGEAVLDAGSNVAASGVGASVLVWSDGSARAHGTISAKGVDGGGGFVETSARSLDLNGARVDTGGGRWLIDPNDFTIAASGGNMTGADVGAALVTGDLAIATATMGTPGSGDIHVNDAVSWSANTLTLSAERDINVNAVMTASGASALAMNTTSGAVKVGMNGSGFTGRVDFPGRSGTGFLTINSNGYTVINSLGAEGSVTGTDLQGMNGGLAGSYALGSNIDATATSGWNTGAGFNPVGSSATPFTGQFNGLGHTINNLAINRGGQDWVGLFGKVYWYGAVLSNVGLVGGSVIGKSDTGGLVGYIDQAGGITNAYNTGSVTSPWSWCCSGIYVGGLVGANYHTPINNSFATGNVTGDYHAVGGLVGSNRSWRAVISNSFATGNVTCPGGSAAECGGLVGQQGDGGISKSYATGNVVSNGRGAGGLVGTIGGTGWIADSYATGNVTFTGGGAAGGPYGAAGGLVGWMTNWGSVSNSYATGSVTSVGAAGGLVGANDGIGGVSNSFWDTQTSGQAASAGGTGLTTAQMKSAATFTAAGWDPATWQMADGAYPLLKAFMSCAYGACWTGGASGEWSLPANWYHSHVPGPGESVLIDVPGLITVTYSDAATASLGSLVSNENFTLDSAGGGIAVSGATTFSAGSRFTLASGTATFDGITSLGSLDLRGGTLTGSGAITLGGSSNTWSGGTISGSGSFAMPGAAVLTLSGSGTRVLDGRTLEFGTFALPGSSLEVASGALNSSGTATISAGATLIASGGSIGSASTMNVAGTLRTGAGSVSAPDIVIASTGVLTGVGAVTGNVSNSGTVAPGNSAGTLTINGDYAQVSGGILDIELNGTASGQYDVLAVSGTATLGSVSAGSRVNFSGTATSGAYPFLTASTLNGIFTQQTGTLSLSLNYGPGGATASFGTFWDGGAGDGNWLSALNWSGNVLPTAGDDVSIGGGAGTVTLATGAQAVRSLNSAASLVLSGGSLTIGSGGGTASGVLSLTGGTLNFASGGSFTKTVGALDWSAGTLSGTGGFSIASGSVNAAGSGARVLEGPSLALGSFTLPGGSLEVKSGALSTSGLTTVNAGATLIASGGSISSTVPMSISGTLRTGAGSISAPAINITPTGLLTGTGSVTAIHVNNNAGTVAPGNPTGTLTINGNYTQHESATLAVQVDGIGAGEYGKLAVSGSASLNGLASFNGADVIGMFPFLTASSVTGTFAGQSGILNPTFGYAANQVTATLTRSGVLWDGGGADGMWLNPRNWNGDALPASGENVTIGASAGAVTLASSAVSVRSLRSDADFVLAGGSSLVLLDNGSFGADLRLNAGTTLTSQGTLNLNTYSLGTGAKINLARSGTGILTIGGLPYTVISSLGAAGSITSLDLQGMNGNLGGRYALGADIDASATSGWNGGEGFLPVGNRTAEFKGKFDGLGHTINNLTIDRPAANDIGLFGLASGASISNVGIVGGSFTGRMVGSLLTENSGMAGALVGTNASGAINNSYATSTVTGVLDVGGLVGFNSGSISNSHASGNISGYSGVGGLVGNQHVGAGVVVSESYATGNVSAHEYGGGLAGINHGAISNSYATGNIGGSSSGIARRLGGLVGSNSGTISGSRASGNVVGGTELGGLAGISVGTAGGGVIRDSYATGNIDGMVYIGGLVGINSSGTIERSYASGTATNGGGLVGSIDSGGGIVSSFWDVQTSGNATCAAAGGVSGCTGLTTVAMIRRASFGGWDFGTVWAIEEGRSYPYLRASAQVPHPAPSSMSAVSTTETVLTMPANDIVTLSDQFFSAVNALIPAEEQSAKRATPECKSAPDELKQLPSLECK